MALAYIFERFPAHTQTFCIREVTELLARGVEFPVYSIRREAEAENITLPESVHQRLVNLPRESELRTFYTESKASGVLPQAAVLTIRHWGEVGDKERVYEAIWLGQKLKAAGITHVHCHFAGLAARTCWWLRQLYGIRYSFTAHANDVFCQDESVVTLAHLMQAAECVVTVSNYTAQWLRDRFPAAGRKIQVVYNGLELKPITDHAAATVKAEPPLIASVGRLIEKKGFDDLITACALLRDAGIAYQCEILGGGPDEAALQQQIQQNNLTDHVRLLGSHGQSVVRDLLGRASVFALPCVTEKSGGMDNLPTVLMEAMAARLPCASTFLAGVPEMLAEGTTGLLCGERQPRAFADLLERLLADAPLRSRMGEAGLQRAEQLFSKAQTVPQLHKVLHQAGAVPAGPGSYPLSAKIRHFIQPKTPKARCCPATGGKVSWVPEK